MKWIAFALTAVLCLPTAFAQQWTSFQNGGVLKIGPAKLPTEWSPDQGIAWEKKLAGYGQSSPVVYGKSVYLTSVTGSQKENVNVESFSIADGKRNWIHSLGNSTPQENTVMISRAAPSPAVDDQGIIAMFEGGNLIALDHGGKLRWQRDLAAELGGVKARHGLAASLEQNKDQVFVWVEKSEAPYVIAVNKQDGKTIWKADGVGSTSWGSPRLVPVNESQHLVLSASGKIIGLDPVSGDRLWEFDGIEGNTTTTPIPLGNGRFLVGATAGRGGGTPKKPCSGVIEIKQQLDGDTFEAAWIWSSKTSTTSFGSPIAVDGKAYFVNRSGIVNCHDLETGDKRFKGRVPGGQVWATPLAADGKLYFFGKSGTTSVVESGDQLTVISDNRLWEVEADKPATNQDQKGDRAKGDRAKDDRATSPFSSLILYAAAVGDDRLFLRRGDRIFAIGP